METIRFKTHLRFSSFYSSFSADFLSSSSFLAARFALTLAITFENVNHNRTHRKKTYHEQQLTGNLIFIVATLVALEFPSFIDLITLLPMGKRK